MLHVEQISPPYADITGIMKGKKAVQIYRCPIVFNNYSECFEFIGAENISVVEIKYNWPTMMSDMNNATRRRLKKEKDRLQSLTKDNQLEVNGEVYDKEFYHKKSKGSPTQRELNTRKVELI